MRGRRRGASGARRRRVPAVLGRPDRRWSRRPSCGRCWREASSWSQAGRELIAAANAAGGRDNITVVLFRLEDVDGGRGGRGDAGGAATRAARDGEFDAFAAETVPAPSAGRRSDARRSATRTWRARSPSAARPRHDGGGYRAAAGRAVVEQPAPADGAAPGGRGPARGAPPRRRRRAAARAVVPSSSSSLVLLARLGVLDRHARRLLRRRRRPSAATR